jgi:hypothetical protein
VTRKCQARFLKGWGRVTVPGYLAFTRNRAGPLREIVQLAVDRPEMAGVHLAVTGTAGLDLRLIHGLDAA